MPKKSNLPPGHTSLGVVIPVVLHTELKVWAATNRVSIQAAARTAIESLVAGKKASGAPPATFPPEIQSILLPKAVILIDLLQNAEQNVKRTVEQELEIWETKMIARQRQAAMPKGEPSEKASRKGSGVKRTA